MTGARDQEGPVACTDLLEVFAFEEQLVAGELIQSGAGHDRGEMGLAFEPLRGLLDVRKGDLVLRHAAVRGGDGRPDRDGGGKGKDWPLSETSATKPSQNGILPPC